MSPWLRKLHTKRIFVSGLIYTGIAFVLRQVEVLVTMKYYTDPALAGLWSRTMMPSNGPPPPAFFVQSLFFTFAAGVTLAAVFEFLRPVLGKPYWERVVNFTDIAVGLAIVFGFFPMILMFNVPIQLVASWFVTSWITVFLGTMVFAARTK